jgi:hypothetical protein
VDLARATGAQRGHAGGESGTFCGGRRGGWFRRRGTGSGVMR